VAAAANRGRRHRRALVAALTLAAATAAATLVGERRGAAQARAFTDAEILGAGNDGGLRVESFRTRFTHYDQEGRGFQSQAERGVGRPGRETLTVEQPQVELVARHGKFTHRIWVPVDVVTAASPDAVDTITSASRINEAGTLDLQTRYRATPTSDLTLRAAFHLEENFRSWILGIGGARSFADDNTTLAVTLNEVLDWLDTYDHTGARTGRAYRSTTNLNLTLTQLLSPTTVAALSYGGSLQLGELSNTWNAVPLANGAVGDERLPRLRHRHAFAARLAQALPWRGVLKAFYRFYVDDWGILAHSLEAQLYQRIGRLVWVRANYRVHHQTAASFWTSAAPIGPADDGGPRTADSDLASFVSQTFGGMIALDVPTRSRIVRDVHLDFGYDRYVRTNAMHVDLYTCAMGLRF
jgi:hypothetical protein